MANINLQLLVDLISILSINYIIINSEGPFGIFSYIRNFLLQNKKFGVFFFNLLNCYFCSGFWAGIIYHLIFKDFSILSLLNIGLIGAFTSLVIFKLLNKLD